VYDMNSELTISETNKPMSMTNLRNGHECVKIRRSGMVILWCERFTGPVSFSVEQRA